MRPDPAADPDAAVAALIRNEVKVERFQTPGHRIVRFVVGRRHGLGWTLPRYLRAIHPNWPPALVARWCADGRVTVDDAVAGPAHLVATGQRIELKAPNPPPDPALGPVPPLELLYHDRDLAVVNKPTGQLAHQAGQVLSGTVLDQLQAWAEPQGIAPREVRLINRIDRETSGALIASLSLEAHRRLAAALDEGRIAKTYRAVCHGAPQPVAGIWDAPLAAEGPHTIRRCVHADGQPSQTGYRTLAVAPGGRFALLELDLITGRQHQIRVHAAHHGHPLVGDWVYGTPVAGLPGQALHAWALDLPHPGDGRRIRIEAPFRASLAELWERLASGGAVTVIPLNDEQRSKLG